VVPSEERIGVMDKKIVETLDVYHVAMPMKERWRTAFGEMDTVDSVFVRMTLDGAVGWGEAAPYAAPQYCSEFAAGAFAVIRDWLGPSLLGRSVTSGTELQRLLSPFKGNHFAKSALDVAWWDAYARLTHRPLWQAIGGKTAHVSVGADVAVQTDITVLLDILASIQEAGFARTKLKFRADWGVEMVAQVRERFPDGVFHVDCNSGFRLEDRGMFKQLDTYGLAMIEQPLGHDDLIDHAKLQGDLETPLCLDESIVSPDAARKAIDLGACGWINLKVGRLGGLTNAISVHDLCRERGVPCWVGGMLESAVGQGPSIALSTLENIKYPADIFPSDRFYEIDLSEPEIRLDGPGFLVAPDQPGHGFKPNKQRLEAHKVHHASIEPS
jgi:O-succinylbenzoate synthase